MIIHLAIRGYASGLLVFEDRVEMDADAFDDEVVAKLAEKHSGVLAKYDRHMIEIEFLDEPDPNQRYCRFGTDPTGMVLPMAMSLSPEARRFAYRVKWAGQTREIAPHQVDDFFGLVTRMTGLDRAAAESVLHSGKPIEHPQVKFSARPVDPMKPGV